MWSIQENNNNNIKTNHLSLSHIIPYCAYNVIKFIIGYEAGFKRQVKLPKKFKSKSVQFWSLSSLVLTYAIMTKSIIFQIIKPNIFVYKHHMNFSSINDKLAFLSRRWSPKHLVTDFVNDCIFINKLSRVGLMNYSIIFQKKQCHEIVLVLASL